MRGGRNDKDRKSRLIASVPRGAAVSMPSTEPPLPSIGLNWDELKEKILGWLDDGNGRGDGVYTAWVVDRRWFRSCCCWASPHPQRWCGKPKRPLAVGCVAIVVVGVVGSLF